MKIVEIALGFACGALFVAGIVSIIIYRTFRGGWWGF